MESQGRILTRNWDLYDTRNVVYQTRNLSAKELKSGYDWAYKEFYSWKNILRSSFNHESHMHKLKHFFYAGGWKKFEPVWNFLIKTKNLNNMLPVLESILAKVRSSGKNNYTGLSIEINRAETPETVLSALMDETVNHRLGN